MSQSEFDADEVKADIAACSADPRAEEIGYRSANVATEEHPGFIVYHHLDREGNPDAWIKSDWWCDIEALGAREYTKRNDKRE